MDELQNVALPAPNVGATPGGMRSDPWRGNTKRWLITEKKHVCRLVTEKKHVCRLITEKKHVCRLITEKKHVCRGSGRGSQRVGKRGICVIDRGAVLGDDTCRGARRVRNKSHVDSLRTQKATLLSNNFCRKKDACQSKDNARLRKTRREGRGRAHRRAWGRLR